MTRRRLHARGWASGFRRMLAAAAGVLALPGAAAATHLDGFVYDFEHGLPTPAFFEAFCRHALPCTVPGPLLNTFATSPSFGKYLGSFGEEAVSFHALDMLDIIALVTDRAYLSFDLILTGAWFGSGSPPFSAPDFETFFKVVANGKTLFDSTVDNFSSNFRHFDLIFDFTPGSPSCCTDVAIEFSARFGPGFDDWEFPALNPGWGIDNFVVSSTPIPEPGTGVLVGLGLLLLAARKHSPAALL